MDPQRIPPKQNAKDKQPMTAISPKTVSTLEKPSKQPNPKQPTAKQPNPIQPNSKQLKPDSKKKKPEVTAKTTQETSKVGATLDLSKPSVTALNAISPRRNLPSVNTIEKHVTKKEMTDIVKTSTAKKKNAKDEPKTKTEQRLALIVDGHPPEPIRSDEYPFYFNRRVITFIGRIGQELVDTYLVITNVTKFPYLFKIKCSNNNLFRIQPNYGFIDAMTDAEIKITYGGSHVPPLYQEWFTIHAMKPDPMCLNIYESIKAKTQFDARRRILADFAYHEDVNYLMGDQPGKVYKQNVKLMHIWISKALVKRKEGERRTRLARELIPKSPTRNSQNLRERASQYYKGRKEKCDWKDKSKTGGVKPLKQYKWEYLMNDEDKKIEEKKRKGQEKKEEEKKKANGQIKEGEKEKGKEDAKMKERTEHGKQTEKQKEKVDRNSNEKVLKDEKDPVKEDLKEIVKEDKKEDKNKDLKPDEKGSSEKEVEKEEVKVEEKNDEDQK